MEKFLAEVSKEIDPGKHCAMILDRAAWHTSKKLTCSTNITLIPLPPYSPELNPIEQLWQQLKQKFLSNRCFENYDDIVEACCDAWNSYTENLKALVSLCFREWAFIA